jgi:hypothetical protein
VGERRFQESTFKTSFLYTSYEFSCSVELPRNNVHTHKPRTKKDHPVIVTRRHRMGSAVDFKTTNIHSLSDLGPSLPEPTSFFLHFNLKFLRIGRKYPVLRCIFDTDACWLTCTSGRRNATCSVQSVDGLNGAVAPINTGQEQPWYSIGWVWCW